jgi:hypothetical protein
VTDDRAREEAEREFRGPRMHVGTVTDREIEAFCRGAAWQAAQPVVAPGATHPDHWRRHGHEGQPCPGDGPCYRGSQPAPLTVTAEVAAERQRQIEQGHTTARDDQHGAVHLIDWARNYAVRAAVLGNRSDIIKAVALLIAAVETFDRLASFDGITVEPTP